MLNSSMINGIRGNPQTTISSRETNDATPESLIWQTSEVISPTFLTSSETQIFNNGEIFVKSISCQDSLILKSFNAVG